MSRLQITARVNYVNLATPAKYWTEQKAYWRLDVIVPKSDRHTIALIDDAVRRTLPKGAALDEVGTLLKDGDMKRQKIYWGCYFFTAKRSTHLSPPRVTGASGSDEVHNGKRARLGLTATTYMAGGKLGVSFRLDEIEFI